MTTGVPSSPQRRFAVLQLLERDDHRSGDVVFGLRVVSKMIYTLDRDSWGPDADKD